MIPDPTETPTLAVADAGRILYGFGRAKSYLEARRYIETGGVEGIPCIRFGHTLRCPTAQCLAQLGLDAPNGSESNGGGP